MKKRLLVAVLLCMLMVLCIGCSKDSSNEEATESPKKQEDTTIEAKYDWAQNTTFYQIFVRSFYDSNGDGIGDFNGIAEKVDYLKELGVGAVWLMPIMESTTYHGYDVVDYYNVNPDYGTMDDFKSMLKVLQDNDIKVIIDLVVNHTSSENEWFKTALSDNSSNYFKWYDIRKNIDDVEDKSEFRTDSKTGLFYYGLYDSIMPDLNYDNTEVRDEIKKVAGFWLDLGINGFRLDGANNIYAEDPDKTNEWWKEFTNYVKEKDSSAFVVGENWLEDAEELAPCYSALYSSFDFPLCSKLKDVSGKKFADFVSDFNKEITLYKDTAAQSGSANSLPVVSTMIDNHDMDRIATRLDAVGARLAATMLLTLPGTPFIYYGDEIGQTGQSPDVNRREAFDWYKAGTGTGMVDLKKATGSDAVYTIANDGISYEEQKDKDVCMFARYKKLIAIRNANKVMYTGEYTTIGATETGMLAYTIKGAEDNSIILVVHNTGDAKQSFTLKVDGNDLLNDKELKAGSKVELYQKDSIIIKYTSDESPIDAKEFNYSVEELNKPKEQYNLKLVVTLPKNTPKDEDIYVCGTFSDWDETNKDYIMKRTSDTTCEITITAEAQSDLEFKFLRDGTWDKREQNAKSEDLVGKEQKQNRVYTLEENNKELDLTVEKWMDID